MKPLKTFLFALIVISSTITIFPQNKISIDILQDLSSLDPGAFLISNGINNQPRVFQITIISNKTSVVVEGSVDWKENYNASFQNLLTFTTKPVEIGPTGMRIFFNDQMGSSDVRILRVQGDKKKGEDLVTKGKPSGIFYITLKMFDDQGRFLADNLSDGDKNQIIFLNPTAPEITSFPNETELEVSVGNIQLAWVAALGAQQYEVLVREIKGNETAIEAIEGSEKPHVEEVISPTTTTINLVQYKKREFTEGKKYAVRVSTIGSYGRTEPSEVREFVVASSSSPNNSKTSIDPTTLRLINVLSNKLDQELINQLSDGSQNITRFENENGNRLSNDEFIKILGYLELNTNQIINVSFNAK